MILEPPKHVGQRRRIECTSESTVPFGVIVDGVDYSFTETDQMLELEGRHEGGDREAPLIWKVVRVGRAGHAVPVQR